MTALKEKIRCESQIFYFDPHTKECAGVVITLADGTVFIDRTQFDEGLQEFYLDADYNQRRGLQ